MKNNRSFVCIFCGAVVLKKYKLNGRDIGRCEHCKTMGVLDMPTPDEVSAYYQGFSFQTNITNYALVNTGAIRKWMQSFVLNSPARMLDVGGGGGFFAKAFENFGLGESTYIDLDAEACAFAKKLGLDRVIHGSVEDVEAHVGGQKFDFIYCRHVIEHLICPKEFIISCSNLLAPGGTFVLQCPNGASKEGILFPRYWLSFLRRTKESNSWSRVKTFLFSLSSSYGWGLDPIRHLWAITPKGLQALFGHSNDFSVVIKTASRADPVYSPYWKPNRRTEIMGAVLSRILTGTFVQGMHLIAFVRRK